MIEVAGCDAVLVINHQTPVAAMAARLRAGGHRRVLVVASHLLFPHERVALERALAPATVHATSLADWFTDEELAGCDDATTAALQAAPRRWAFYVERFEEAAAARKNALALAALRRAGLPGSARLYAADGLGICAAAWREAGAASLPPQPTWRQVMRRSAGGQAYAYLRTLARGVPAKVLRLREDGTAYLFAGSLRRLELAPGVVAEEVTLAAARAAREGPCFLAVGLHDYSPELRRAGLPLRIFVDGFLPPNYPRTYLDAYGDAEFVCADPVSVRWLRDGGCRIAPVPGFLATGEFAPARAPAEVATCVFFLQHAGNWTSLINRSDNDALVAAALELAASEPDLRIILRLHPSMEHPRHEGAGASARLRAAVRAAGYRNVEFSAASLAEDLARGDLLVAEYSAALINGWRSGRPGLAVNPTRRRSFFQAFADLGFAHATGSGELGDAVRRFRSGAAEFVARQSQAAARYNDLVRAHRARG